MTFKVAEAILIMELPTATLKFPDGTRLGPPFRVAGSHQSQFSSSTTRVHHLIFEDLAAPTYCTTAMLVVPALEHQGGYTVTDWQFRAR
jgi:hypothetical protein